MRSFRWLPALALPLLVVLAARAQDEKMPTSPYFPLEVGGTWTYRAGEATFQYKVARVETVGNKTKAARIDLVIGNRVVSHEHVTVTKDGAVQRLAFEGKELKSPITLLPAGLKEGAEWAVDSKVGGEALSGKFVLRKLKEKVKAGGKDYEAVVVAGKDLKANGAPVALKYYFAKDLGMVKQELEVAGNKVVFELTSYEPPKKSKESKE
jgi:hypothetical protein